MKSLDKSSNSAHGDNGDARPSDPRIQFGIYSNGVFRELPAEDELALPDLIDQECA